MSKTNVSTVLRQIVRDRAQNACEYCFMPELAVLTTCEIMSSRYRLPLQSAESDAGVC